MTANQVLDALMSIYQHGRATMPDDELKPLTALTECAVDEARRMAKVCEWVECFVSYDGTSERSTGILQDAASVATLMFSLSHQAEVIAALMHIGDSAADELNRRRPAVANRCIRAD